MMNTTFRLGAGLALLAVSALGMSQSKTFKVLDDKLQFRNLATVESSTDFETFTGRTSKVTGSIVFDVAKKTGSGTIEVDAASIDTAIELRNEHMRSAGWLDVAKYPTIKFATTSVKSKGGDRYAITGAFTLHGVTRTVSTEATVRYRPESAETKAVGFEGNVILISTSFKVKLSDFGIKIPSQAAGKVSDTVVIGLKAYATGK